MKYAVSLGIALISVWFIWSGRTDPWLVSLGLASTIWVVFLTFALRILDSESVPIWLGMRPFTEYLPWLLKEIVLANLDVTRRILDPDLPINPFVVQVTASQRTELGRVILANSITLTPGTVSIEMQENHIQVHALSYNAADQDLTGDIDRRVTKLEGRL